MNITTTCCRLVGDLLAMSLASTQQVRNKLAASLSTGKLQGNVCNGFWALTVTKDKLQSALHPQILNIRLTTSTKFSPKCTDHSALRVTAELN